MKNKGLLLIVAFLLTAISFAQGSSINYKAIIKDGSGNVVENTGITVQFNIENSLAQTVYTETHNPTTDVNGLVILNIGEGTTSDTFTDIVWGSEDHSLNVQIDITGGTTFVDTGTTEFKAVPYALNVTGLEQITESGKTGWRLKGQDPANYGDIGLKAVDLSYTDAISTTLGATGNYSTAMGYFTTALGGGSTAMGEITAALGARSTALGYFTTASGLTSTAMGDHTKAEASGSTAIGRYNIGGGHPTDWNGIDPLFEIGNGDNFTLSNALTILKNGTITAPSFDLAEITDSKALITKEYADTNLVSSGLEKITENGKTGWRLKGKNPANYGNIGNNALDFSYSSTTSTTFGATGNYSRAMGNFTKASGTISTAMGASTTASGKTSTAMGSVTTASGKTSTAMGRVTKAESHSSTALGSYNIGGGDPLNWLATDPLLEVGNSELGLPRSNALTILKNGTITAPSFDLAEITDNKALITKEYADTNFSYGLEQIIENGNTGWRLKGRDPANYGNIGDNAVDLSYIGNASTIKGATGSFSIAVGNNTEASGLTSTAMGASAIAIGDFSTAMGKVTKAESYNSTAIGSYNVGGGDPLTWVATDPLFEVGNSELGTPRSNALTILKNGNTGIGTATPSFKLSVQDSKDAGFIAQIYNESTNTDADGLKIRLGGAPPTTDNYYIGFFGGANGNNGKIAGNGAGVMYATTSDRRLKQNIKDINQALDLINQIQPRTYAFKKTPNVEEYGFIAQELQPLYPQAVSGSPDSDVTKKPMMVDYSRLTPLLTAGIKELNDKVGGLNEKVESLEKENKVLKQQLSKYEILEARLSLLEKQTTASSTLTAEK